MKKEVKQKLVYRFVFSRLGCIYPITVVAEDYHTAFVKARFELVRLYFDVKSVTYF